MSNFQSTASLSGTIGFTIQWLSHHIALRVSPCTVSGFVNDKKQFPRQLFAFSVDGIATVAGSLMGTSPIATYIESASGIREGGRTGITALTVALYFFISLFFVPVLCAPSRLCPPSCLISCNAD